MKSLMKSIVVSAALIIGGVSPARADWTYSNKVMTEVVAEGVTPWKFSVVVSGTSLTSLKKTQVGDSAVLDISAPITDAKGSRYSLTSIAQDGLNGATTLVEVRLPETLTTIGGYGFLNCTSLTNVVPFLPASVTTVGQSAFLGCGKLVGKLTLSNPAPTTIGANAFQNLTGITAADFSASGLTSVGQDGFHGCSKLGEVLFPETMETFVKYSFCDCTALTNMTTDMPSVKAIGERAFRSTKISGDLKLSSPNLITVGASAFYGAKLTSVDFTGSSLSSLGQDAFHDNKLMTNAVLPATFASFGADYEFAGCAVLSNVHFAASAAVSANVFNSAMGLPGRFTFPKNDSAAWKTKSGTSFRKWPDGKDDGVSAASATETNAYAKAFPDGPQPIGYGSFGGVNHWLVPIALGGDDEHVSLEIVGQLADGTEKSVGTPDPAYRVKVEQDGFVPISCTISRYGDDGDTWFECAGWRIDEMDESSSWVEGSVTALSGAADPRAVTWTPTKAGIFRLVWVWNPIGCRVSLGTFPAAVGSVSVTPPDYGADFYRYGSGSVTFTASGDGFERWFGSGGAADARTVAVDADKPKTVTPIFRTDWTYGNGVLSDGYWKIAATCDANGALSLGKPTQCSVLLDFSKPVTGGERVVALNQDSFGKNYTAALKNLGEVVFGNDLRNIGGYAFMNCSALERFTLAFPKSLTWIGQSAFIGTKLSGAIVLTNPNFTTIDSCAFQGTGVTTADFSKSGLTAIGQDTFKNSALKRISFPPTFTRFSGDYSFTGCADLADIEVRSYLEFNAHTLAGAKGLPGRIRFPDSGSAYDSWTNRFAQAGSGFTTWAAATQSQRNDYRGIFPSGRAPLGYMSIGGATRWFVPFHDNAGMKLVFR